MIATTTDTSSKITVYGFAQKTRILINSGIIPEVTSAESFFRVTGLSKANYHKICGNELTPRPGGKLPRVTITHKVLNGITKAYGLPDSYFTNDCTLSEFEHMLSLGPWKDIISLAGGNHESNFKALRASQNPDNSHEGPTEDHRFGPIGPAKTDEHKLGVFTILQKIAFDFKSKPSWNVLLLNRQPEGKVVSLLPNNFGSNHTLNEEGYLRLPEEDFWLVKDDTVPGNHVFAAIFYDSKVSELLLDMTSYSRLFGESSRLDDQRSALSDLYNRLSKLKSKSKQPFEIVIKELYVAAG